MISGAKIKVNIAAAIETKNVIFLVFLKPLSRIFPLILAKIGNIATLENATIAAAETTKLNEIW